MPDLSTEAVTRWLDRIDPGIWTQLPQAFRPPEADPGVITHLEALGTGLDHAAARNPAHLAFTLSEGQGRDLIRAVSSQLGACRTLRLMDWLADPDLAQFQPILERLLDPDDEGAGQALEATLHDLNRHALIRRLFSKDRLSLLLKASRSLP